MSADDWDDEPVREPIEAGDIVVFTRFGNGVEPDLIGQLGLLLENHETQRWIYAFAEEEAVHRRCVRVRAENGETVGAQATAPTQCDRGADWPYEERPAIGPQLVERDSRRCHACGAVCGRTEPAADPEGHRGFFARYLLGLNKHPEAEVRPQRTQVWFAWRWEVATMPQLAGTRRFGIIGRTGLPA